MLHKLTSEDLQDVLSEKNKYQKDKYSIYGFLIIYGEKKEVGCGKQKQIQSCN